MDGIAKAVPVVDGVGQVLDRDGHPVGGGAPTRAHNWIDDPDLTGWDLAEGRGPVAADEVVVDRATADDAGLTVGDTATVLVPDPVEATVVGIATFGDRDTLGRETFVAFTTEEAQRLLLGSTDEVSAIVAAGDPRAGDDGPSRLSQGQLFDNPGGAPVRLDRVHDGAPNAELDVRFRPRSL